MTHEEIQGRLNEWFDGELDPAASADASRHIDACGACKAEVGRLRRLGAALFNKHPVTADPRSTEAFVARVMSRIEADSVSPWDRFAARVLAPSFGLALAGLLLAISLPHVDEDAPLGVEYTVDTEAVLEAAP